MPKSPSPVIITITIMIMMMIRSSPRSPPLLSPHPVRWTGDLVLKTSTITSLYQGITNIMMTMTMIIDDDDDDNHCRQRPSSLKKSTSLVSTTSPQSYLGSGTNHNPHLATATEITRWHIQSDLSHQCIPMVTFLRAGWTSLASAHFPLTLKQQ